MSYTRTQLKQATQAKSDLVTKTFKSNPVAGILGAAVILGTLVGITAGIGVQG